MRGTSILGVIVVIWLVIGAVAAGQRGYHGNDDTNCAEAGTILVTIVAGPLELHRRQPEDRLQAPRAVESKPPHPGPRPPSGRGPPHVRSRSPRPTPNPRDPPHHP